MREVLEPLAGIPGVHTAVLVTSDGVPIAVQGRALRREPQHEPQAVGPFAALDPEPAVARACIDSSEELNALAALGTGWLSEITRSVLPLSWSPPRCMSMRAARGTLIVMQAPNAVLLVLLDGGMPTEELRLPMEAAIARMQRVLRGGSRKDGPAEEKPPGIFPAAKSIARAGVDPAKGVPEVSGGR